MAVTDPPEARNVEYQDEVRVRAGDNPCRFGVELWVHLYRHPDRMGQEGTHAVVSSYQVQEVDPRMMESPAEPLLLRREAAQELLDDLWHAGIRPTNLKDDSRLVETLQEALADAERVRDQVLPLALRERMVTDTRPVRLFDGEVEE